MNFIEKRKMERFLLGLPAWISVVDESQKQKTIEEITSDVFSGGAFFKVVNPLPLGTAVDIKMLLSFKNFNKIGSTGLYMDVTGSVIRTKKKVWRLSLTNDFKFRL